MDPIAHSFTGAALAAAGMRRATPLATAALLVGANIPDVDVLTALGPDFASLAYRRGLTHGLLAIVVWPFVVTGLLLLYDRYLGTGPPDRAPVKPRVLLGVSALAVLTHPTLDWLNNYGMRWLMPFDDRWFYGDALFIIDPWVWLGLGGVLCVAHSRGAAAIAAWAAFWLLGTLLMLTAPDVPLAARTVWIAGLVIVVAARARRFGAAGRPPGTETAARAALGVVAIYMTVSLALNIPARAEVRRVLESDGIGPVERVMVAPVTANPFAGWVLAETASAYYTGNWRWFAEQRFEPSAAPIAKLPRTPVVAAASATPDAQRYLTWSRFPLFEVRGDGDGYVVRISDARYGGAGGRLGGPTVYLDGALRPRAAAAASGP